MKLRNELLIILRRDASHKWETKNRRCPSTATGRRRGDPNAIQCGPGTESQYKPLWGDRSLQLGLLRTLP